MRGGRENLRKGLLKKNERKREHVSAKWGSEEKL